MTDFSTSSRPSSWWKKEKGVGFTSRRQHQIAADAADAYITFLAPLSLIQAWRDAEWWKRNDATVLSCTEGRHIQGAELGEVRLSSRGHGPRMNDDEWSSFGMMDGSDGMDVDMGGGGGGGGGSGGGSGGGGGGGRGGAAAAAAPAAAAAIGRGYQRGGGCGAAATLDPLRAQADHRWSFDRADDVEYAEGAAARVPSTSSSCRSTS